MSDRKISVIGLGYVGLPVAVAFGKKQRVIGFDVNEKRLQELTEGHDSTLEVDDTELKYSDICFTSSTDELSKADFHIVAVPTPIDASKKPDLSPLIGASKSVGAALKKGDIVVFESTVYPGATEEDCVPVLEQTSGLTCGKDFFVGYSPERINPGDKEHTFTKIRKVVSGQTPQVLDIVAAVYESVVTAGVYKAQSIKVAEAAKVIENTQRDLNIALVNELAVIFSKMGIDTNAVLEAAGTKWNFLPFKPGLVGGHCIGVDPYYLTHKAQTLGYHPEVILAGRKINDSMGAFVVNQLVKSMIKKRIHIEGSKVLLMGLTFKENCPDLRNTKVVDIIRELAEFNIQVDVYDPWVNKEEAVHEYGVAMVETPARGEYDSVIVAVAHEEFKALGVEGCKGFGKDTHVLVDLKNLFSIEDSDVRL